MPTFSWPRLILLAVLSPGLLLPAIKSW